MMLSDRKMEKEEEERKGYKVPVIYLRKSKAGEHLYAFNVSAKDANGNALADKMVLGGNIGSLIVNVSDVEKVVAGKMDWAKVSVLPAEERE